MSYAKLGKGKIDKFTADYCGSDVMRWQHRLWCIESRIQIATSEIKKQEQKLAGMREILKKEKAKASEAQITIESLEYLRV